MNRTFATFAFAIAGLIGFSGCCGSGCRDSVSARPVVLPPGPVVAPPQGVPVQSFQAIPQQPAPIPGAAFVPNAPPPAYAGSQVVQGGYTPSAPTNPAPRVQEPVVRLSPPQLSVPPQTPEPPMASGEKGDQSSAFPVDIPQFAMARERVASGHQPFPDGVYWLKSHGYKAVLHIHAPGTDDSAARRQFESNGLRYLSLEADAATLSKELVDRFNKIVADEANLPLFVYDKDSSIAGGFWYLNYRLVDGMTEEKARAEVARLGFRADQDDSQRTMWVAVQKLLEKNGR